MMLPNSTPKMSLADCAKIIKKAGVTDKCVLVGVRGYYEDTMGKSGKNDRGIYDDAIFLVTPTAFLSVNANVDPSVYRKGIASLKTGVWKYKPGIHGLSHPVGPRRYPALVQAEKVTVSRDGQADTTGFFGINIHRGSRNSTSSVGCQTIYPTQWDHFKTLVYAELKRHEQKVIPYILVDA